MENKLFAAMRKENSRVLTENGGISYNTTMNPVYDLFALGGAYRTRSDEDCILLFKKALEYDAKLAIKCLFWLRDIRGGQGERRFFRVCMKWLAKEYPFTCDRLISLFSEYGRWDDLFTLVGTPCEKAVLNLIKGQFFEDIQDVRAGRNPSLLAKWLPSANASSRETKQLANLVMNYFGISPRNYRKSLSYLRRKIRLVETQMSQNEWDTIQYDKLPSKAGMKYSKAFARHDEKRYSAFMNSKTTKVNAGTLYPVDVVHKVINNMSCEWSYPKGYYNCVFRGSDTEYAMINKYWDNLTDYFNGAAFDGVAVVDTSGSMYGTPIDVAIAIGMYCAEKCDKNSPFYGHYISFSKEARLVPVEGVDFVDKVTRIYSTNLCENTNIESVFDLILRTALENNLAQGDLPKNVVIISDMEFDQAQGYYGGSHPNYKSVLENMEDCYHTHGYEMPNLIFWNVNARSDQIPMRDKDGITFVSGYSASTFEHILSGKSSMDFMMDILNSERYAPIGEALR